MTDRKRPTTIILRRPHYSTFQKGGLSGCDGLPSNLAPTNKVPNNCQDSGNTLTKNSAYSDWRQLAGICAGTTDDGNGNDNVGRSFYGSGRTRLACSTKSSYIDALLRKAYDLVARDFPFQALESFGLASPFIHMIRKLNKSTTAKF